MAGFLDYLKDEKMPYPKIYLYSLNFFIISILLLLLGLAFRIRIVGLVGFFLIPLWMCILGIAWFINKKILTRMNMIHYPIEGKIAQLVGISFIILGLGLAIYMIYSIL